MRQENRICVALGVLLVVVATLSTTIAATSVSPPSPGEVALRFNRLRRCTFDIRCQQGSLFTEVEISRAIRTVSFGKFFVHDTCIRRGACLYRYCFSLVNADMSIALMTQVSIWRARCRKSFPVGIQKLQSPLALHKMT
jgi:hypothetical protein